MTNKIKGRAGWEVDALSDCEILTVITGSSRASEAILEHCELGESFTALQRWSVAEFAQIRGVGSAIAAKLAACFAIHRRISPDGIDESTVFSDSDIVANYMSAISHASSVEKFWVLCLNQKNRLLKRVEVTSGTATSSLVHPREVYRAAIHVNAAAIIAVHNHPSGDPAPSRADIEVTRRLRDAAKVVGIDLRDHIIIGSRNQDPQGLGHYSFNNAGLI